jgi:hypothetical protein
MSETLTVGAANMDRSPTSVTTWRKFSAILLGLCYGAFFAGGISMGFNSVSQSVESVNWLANSPIAQIILIGMSIAVMGFLAAHSARSVTIGIITSAAGSAIYLLLPGRRVQFLLFMLVGVGGSWLGKSLPIAKDDLTGGRLFGVDWKHWLWLWLPLNFMGGSAVWLCAPGFILAGSEFSSVSYVDLITDVLRAVIAGSFVGYAAIKALRSIRNDVPFSRRQSAMRFILWFGVIQVAAILWCLNVVLPSRAE